MDQQTSDWRQWNLLPTVNKLPGEWVSFRFGDSRPRYFEIILSANKSCGIFSSTCSHSYSPSERSGPGGTSTLLLAMLNVSSSTLAHYRVIENLAPWCRCNRLRCPLARMSGLQCFNMGHNGHGINLYGVSMTLMENEHAGGQSSLGHLSLVHRHYL